MVDAFRKRKASLVLVGVTEGQIAAALNVDPSTVWRVLRGHIKAGPAALKVQGYVAAVTGKTVEELWPAEEPAVVEGESHA